MKNVLIVTPLYYPAVGGASVYFKEYVVDNVSKDFNMYVLTKTFAGSRHGAVYTIPSGNTVSPVIYRIIFMWDAVAAFMYASFLIITKRIDIVHTHTASGLCMGSSLAARVFTCTLIKDLSDTQSSRINVTFPIPDRLISLKGSCEQYARSCGIDKSLLAPTLLPFDREALRKEKLSARMRRKYFIYAGEIKRSKGIGEIVTLAKRLPSFRFILAGPWREETIAAKLLKEHNVELLPTLNHAAVLRYIKNSLVLLQPSDSEGIPRVVIEALALRIPVVCKKGAVWTEMFKNTPGIYLSDFSPSSFQTIVKRLGRTPIPPQQYRHFTVSKKQYRQFLMDVYTHVSE